MGPLLLVVLLAAAAPAQPEVMTGIVTDPQGSTVPGALVQLEVGGAVILELQTGTDGRFTFGIENRDADARPRLLECEAATSTCQMTCASDSDCPIGTRCVDGDGASGSRFFQRCTFPTCF